MAVDSSKVLVNVSYVDGQEVVVGDKTYIGYSTIAAAAAAVGDTGVSVEVTGTLESEVVSGTALNLVFTDGAEVSLAAVTLQDIDTSVLQVNAAWAGSGHADEVEAGYYYGINAFSTFESAYVAATAAVTVEVGSDLDGVTGLLGWNSPYRSAIRISSADGQEYTLTFQSHNDDGLYATNSGQTITIDKEISLVNMAQLMSTSTNTLVTINGNVTSMQMWAGFGGRVDINETGSVTLTYGDGWLTLRGGGTVNVTGSVTDTASIDVATAEAQVKIGYSSIGDARSSNAYENSTNVLTMTDTFVDGGSWLNVGADGWHSGKNSVLMSNSVFKVAKLGIYDDGKFDVTEKSRVILTGVLTVADNAVLTVDYTSSLTARSLTGSGSINITVDAAMLAAGIGKLIDLTDDAAQLDTANITINGTAWDSAQKTFTDAAGNTYTLVIQGNDLWKTDVSMGAIYVNAAWPADTAFGAEVAPGYRYGINAFSGLNQAIDEVAEPEKIVIAAGTYDENAVLFVKGVEVASENAVFSNVWSFGVNSDTGRDFDMETAEKFTVTGDLTVGQFYAEKNANVYVKIDGNLTTVGSFGAKLATQVDVNGTVTVTPPQNGAAQVMVYGTMNVTGTLDVTTGAMGAVLRVGDGRYETEYGKGGVLNVSGADASVVLRNNTGSAIPVTVSAMSSLNISGGATFANETGGMQNLGTVNVDNATLTLGGTLENSGTVTVSGISTLNIGSVNAASGDAHRIQIAAGTTLKDSVIGGEIRVLGDLTVDGELALGNGGIWCGYGSTQTTATISGGMITAKYAMFQYGTYVISADMTLDYGYLSYGGTFTVNSTIKASGQSGEPFYVRGDVTLADGGKLLIDKALWLDYEGAVLTVADGAAVEAGGLKLIADTSMNVNGGSVKVGNTLENNGTFTVSGASTLNIGKLTGNMLQVVADTTLTDSVIGGNVSVGFNAENAADTTLTLAGDTSIGTLYVGKENRTNDYKLVIAGEETTVKLGSLYSRTGSTTTISNGATLDISNYWQSKGTVMVDASTINHSGVNFYVYNNDSADTAAIALMNGAVLNHINAYSLTLGSTNETVSGVAKGNASVTLEGGSTLNVNRLYLNATGTVEEVAGAEAKTSLTAVDSTVTARGEVGIGAGATVSLGNSAFTANTLISSGAIVMDSLSTITCAGAFTSTGTITARVDAAQSGVSFVQKLINASTLTVNDSLTVEGGREGAQLVATGNALWLDNSDKSTILINSEYAGEVGSAIAGRDGYFFGFNALTEYSTSIGADSAVEFTGGSYSFADGFAFTGHIFTVSGDTSFDKVTGGAVAVTGGTLSIDTVELTADVATLSGALLAFSGSGMADLANLVLTVSGTMANRTKYVLATGVKDDSFAVTLNGETYELNVRKDGLLVGVENGELYVQKSNDWFMLSRDTVQTVLPEDGYAFGGSDMHESAVMSVERDLNVATNGQNAGARVYGGGLLRNDALFSGTQKCEVTVTAGGVGKGVIGGNRIESGSIGGTLTSSVTIDSADGTFGFIVGGNQLTGGELNGFGGTSVTIQNGTFSMWICGGSVAGGDAAAQVMGNTNVTITGGTFNGTGVFGGGFVQENGTLKQVGNTNVTISGGTFAGNIYGGHGATNKEASPNGVLFGNTNITISGGIFNGNIYGGGFDQSKVLGDTHITFTGTAGADFSVNGIIDGDASNARYWSKGSFVTGDRYLTFDAFSGEFGATLITNIDQMEVTGGSDVNLKNQLDLSEVSQWEFDFGSSLEGFAQNDLAGDTLVLSGWEDQLGDEGWTVMSGSSITGFGEMEVTNGSNLIFAWNADEQYYLGSIGDEQFKLSMEDGAMKLAKLA